MGVKIVVREDESIERAVSRFKRDVIRSHAGDKWPWCRSFYASPSMLRNRNKSRRQRRYSNGQ
ncbi:30S ribosomal protein S21 [Humisphaera borealis]|uniref:Small ribosomal subunit protein bS21 n=1 Tax=Humisphaera borealis TaxID=2807512 RepID=A0A7M2WV05_9BACT|nr:30S ribosomal protein S21 [Humisphaera borealis]